MKEETKCYCGHTTYCDCGPEEPKQENNMKNLHVIPTPNPSRLYYSISMNGYKLNLSETLKYKSSEIKLQNIYITSNKKIKEGDWKYNELGFGLISKTTKENIDGIKRNKEKGYTNHLYKIILTTDQDLIKDGVQAIDDEFLEWFVQNPSCEEVEVINDTLTVGEMSKLKLGIRNHKYKIIVPKEEIKQETINEAAEKNAQYLDSFENKNTYEYGFKDGAKGQQERSYSEEEVKNLTELFLSYYFKTNKGFDDSFDEWFEQFKKK